MQKLACSGLNLQIYTTTTNTIPTFLFVACIRISGKQKTPFIFILRPSGSYRVWSSGPHHFHPIRACLLACLHVADEQIWLLTTQHTLAPSKLLHTNTRKQAKIGKQASKRHHGIAPARISHSDSVRSETPTKTRFHLPHTYVHSVTLFRIVLVRIGFSVDRATSWDACFTYTRWREEGVHTEWEAIQAHKATLNFPSAYIFVSFYDDDDGLRLVSQASHCELTEDFRRVGVEHEDDSLFWWVFGGVSWVPVAYILYSFQKWQKCAVSIQWIHLR